MYRCETCGAVVGPSRPALKVITETRERHYPQRGEANARATGRRRSKMDPGGTGLEIAEERLLCSACAEKVAPAD
jgi:hypothetical protein